MSKHSPEPWNIYEHQFSDNVDICDANGRLVIRCLPGFAKRVVCAVNSHDILLAALEWLVATMREQLASLIDNSKVDASKTRDAFDRADIAIKQAKGELA